MYIMMNLIVALMLTNYLHLEVGKRLEEGGIKWHLGGGRGPPISLAVGVVEIKVGIAPFGICQVLGNFTILLSLILIILIMLLFTLIVLVAFSLQHHFSYNYPVTILILFVGYYSSCHDKKRKKDLLMVRVFVGAIPGIMYGHMGKGGNVKESV